MAAALSAPFAVAALVLCAAGAAKLRSPAGATAALVVLGLPARRWMIRALAVAELGLGAWALVSASAPAAAALAAIYAVFTVVSVALARRHAACGCFGGADEPVSGAQALLSATLCLVAIAALVAGVHGLGWLLDTSAARAVVIGAGVAAGAYAVVLVYTRLPAAWSAWEGR